MCTQQSQRKWRCLILDLPYGARTLTAEIPEEQLACVLRGKLESYRPKKTPEELIRTAMEKPVASPRLYELAKGKRNIVIIASDHTRAVPSRLLFPPMLEELHRGAPEAKLTVLIATGCHRASTQEELRHKFSDELYEKLHIVVHDCRNSPVTDLGTLPSGAPLRINSIAAQADLLISEGFIEPHFFAGYSGGRKSVLPGICSYETVFANHSSVLIANKNAHSGELCCNPIHRDMAEAAKRAKLAFILNVVCNSQKQIIGAFAGDAELAHKAGTEFLQKLCFAQAPETAGIVLTTNNGYPLDQNLYQAVKSMCTAEAVCKPGGVIITACACDDGLGGDGFYMTFACGKTADEVLRDILAVPMMHTRQDQWQAQILARILAKHKVILISELPDETVRSMGMLPAHSVQQALELANGLVGPEKIIVIPDGVGVIAQIAQAAPGGES